MQVDFDPRLISYSRLVEHFWTLFAPLDAESKYKAKNVIDTVVYRAGDAISAWAKSALDALGQGAGMAALVGALCALLWGLLGWRLGERADRRSSVSAPRQTPA